MDFILETESSVVLDGVQLGGTYDRIDDGGGELVGFDSLTDLSTAGILLLHRLAF